MSILALSQRLDTEPLKSVCRGKLCNFGAVGKWLLEVADSL